MLKRPRTTVCRVPFIYGLVDPLEPEHIRYVGLAATNPRRPYMHMNVRAGSSPTYKDHWVQSLIRDGRMYQVTVLVELPSGSSRAVVCAAEQEQIAALKAAGHRLTNATIGGDGAIGVPAEIRKRGADKRRGRVVSPGEEAKRLAAWTPELRAQVAAKIKALVTPATREASRRGALVNSGRKHTAKTIAKMQATWAGREDELGAHTRGKKQSAEQVAKRVLSTAKTKLEKLKAELAAAEAEVLAESTGRTVN